MGGPLRPTGFAQRDSGQEDRIGLAGGQDRLGLTGFGDESDCRRSHSRILDRRRQRHLVAGTDGHSDRNVPARGHVDDVDAAGLKFTGDLDRLGDVEAVLHPFARREPDEHGHILTDGGPHGLIRLDEQPGTAGKVTAVAVGALVRQRGEEGMEEVAVGGMEFDEVEADPDRPLGRRREGGDHLGDVLLRHLRRLGVAGVGDRAGPERLPAALGRGNGAARIALEGTVRARLPTGMGELHADDRALRVDEVDDRRPRLGVLVAPDPRVLR